MAGLLNDIYAAYRQDQQAAKYGGLLQSYMGEKQGAVPEGVTPQPGEVGGALLQMPPDKFYLEAAAIPGYQSLAQGAQSGQQAMARQIQQQNFEKNNLTMAQNVQLEAQKTRDKWAIDNELWRRENLDAGQQANLGIARGNLAVSQGQLGLSQQRLGFDMAQAQEAARQAALKQQFPAYGLTGQTALDFQAGLGKLDRAAQISTDVVDYLNKVSLGDKTLDYGKTQALQSAYKQHVIPAMAEMVGTGTLQKGDMDFIESVMGTPAKFNSLDSVQKQKVAQILQTVNDERGRRYGMAGVQAPPIQPGSSAWARSQGVEAPKSVKWGVNFAKPQN
jgi:hypothetical protein